MEIIISRLEYTQINKEKLIKIITLLNNEYPIPLDEKIDIVKYVDKIFTRGNILVAENQSEIVGFVTFYSNDLNQCEGAFSLLGVFSSYRRFGVAKMLFIRSFEIMKADGMLTAFSFTHKENFKGLKFHLSLGFEIIKERQVSQRYNISLIKKL